jgi:N-acetylmuramoyl-L-alanine amidase
MVNMNSSGKKLIAGLSAFSLILTSAAAQAMAETTAASALKGTRLYGSNRYETAAEISKAGWNSSDYVVLASGESFADALCAAPLAKKLNAPILLTEKNALDPAAKAELKRLNAKHVIIIGMYGAVSQSAEDSVKAIAGDVKRIGGADRYETSASIAKELGTSSEVAIASGEDYPDALSIASVAASEKMPILLTEKDALPGKVADYINTNKDNITKTYVIGSEGAVSENAAKAASKNEVRLGGKDRFDTNAKVLSSFEDKLNFKNVYVAVGNGAKGTGF